MKMVPALILAGLWLAGPLHAQMFTDESFEGCAADAALDADGDGQTNFAEYRAGTDPRDGASLFSITNLAGWTVLSDAGAPVLIDATTGNTTAFPVRIAPGTEHRFYRIELLP